MDATQNQTQVLLLLPPPPWPCSREALKAAYQGPITHVLKKLAFEAKKSKIGSVLDIALPIPYLHGKDYQPRSALYRVTQSYIAGIYKIVCVVAAQEKIDVETEHGVDVRVFLLDYPRGGTQPKSHSQPITGKLVGPVVTIDVLARSRRPWNNIVSIDSEEGSQILRQFSINQDDRLKIQKVDGGIVHVANDPKEDTPEAVEAFKSHDSVAVGGTFDHIHIGHKLLLTMFAFILANNDSENESVSSLTIGITGDELLQSKKHPELLESWDRRHKRVLAFMRAIMDFRPNHDAQVEGRTFSDAGPNGHAVHSFLGPRMVLKCVEISDPFGPTITDENISALAISIETRSGGKAVNDKRAEKGWPKLEVFEVDVLDSREMQGDKSEDESFQAKLSSTKIREQLSKDQKRQSKA